MPGLGNTGISKTEALELLVQAGQEVLKEYNDDARISAKEVVSVVVTLLRSAGIKAATEPEVNQKASDYFDMSANILEILKSMVPGEE